VQSILPKPGCLVLTDVLRRHSVLEIFHFKVLLKPALTVSSDFNIILFESFFQNSLINIWELPLDIVEVYFDRMESALGLLLLVFQVSDYVRYTLALNEVLVVARLRVEHFFLRFNLSNSIHVIKLPNHYTLNPVLI
jgi:hypothetical protein